MVKTKNSTVLLEMKGITKRFPGIIANDNIDLTLRCGEIHSILGENGAGKTTLMNILSGLYQPDEGEIFFHGQKVVFKSPADAVKQGIGMVHQHLKLVDTLPAWKNIILGYEPTKMGLILKKKAKKRINELQKRFGIFFDLDAMPPQLSACDRQKIEIIKVLYRGAEIIIMDEPTSLLTPNEKEKLIEVLINMAKEGVCSVPFITHKLPEVMKLSNYLTILRKGKVVTTLRADEIKDEESLAEKMVGRKVLFNLQKEEVPKGKDLFSVENIEAFDERGIKTLHGVSLSIRKGEILGLAGVSGNGQKEFVKVIMGLIKPANGKIIFNKKDITNSNVCKRRELGFAYIPDDRMKDGIIPSLSIKENILIGMHKKDNFKKGIFINYSSATDYAIKLVKKFNIDTSNVEKKVGKLSGGNIQKIVLARELSRNPAFILADKPTRGLDVGSQEYIRKVLLEERKKGKAILLISEDLDEISMVSDRITVICQGKIVGNKSCEETSKEEIGMLMAGSQIK